MISPLLLNVALHGMEAAAGVIYRTGKGTPGVAPGAPALIRYADDFVVLCHTRQQADEAQARLAAWLTPRGLAFNRAKTRIVHLTDGFDFLGFTVRRYRNGKLLIKPSRAAIRRIKDTLRQQIRFLRGSNAAEVIRANRQTRRQPAPPRTRRLQADHNRQQRPAASAGQHASTACPSRVRGDSHARFQGGRGAEMRPGYLTTLAYDQGGRTCECNLAPLCRRHHRTKQAAGWTLTQPEPGTLEWSAPHGRRYAVRPSPSAQEGRSTE